MLFQKINKSLFCLVLALSGFSSARASNLVSFVAYPGGPGSGEFSIDSVNSSISRLGPQFDVRAQTFYGVNKVFSSGSYGSDENVKSFSQWTISFNLLGVPTGTIVPLNIGVTYDYSITTGARGAASFGIYLNGDTFTYLVSAITTTNGFGNDFCPELPGARPIGQCAGGHAGVASRIVDYVAGPNVQTITMTSVADTFNTGLTNGYNTARVTSIVIPDDVTFQYTDVDGNPLNVISASDAAGNGVPEPATIGMLAAGIGAMLVIRAKRGKTS